MPLFAVRCNRKETMRFNVFSTLAHTNPSTREENSVFCFIYICVLCGRSLCCCCCRSIVRWRPLVMVGVKYFRGKQDTKKKIWFISMTEKRTHRVCVIECDARRSNCTSSIDHYTGRCCCCRCARVKKNAITLFIVLRRALNICFSLSLRANREKTKLNCFY